MLVNINGYKTYICMVVLGVLGIINLMGYINEETFASITAIIVAAGGSALRHGVTKGINNATNNNVRNMYRDK